MGNYKDAVTVFVSFFTANAVLPILMDKVSGVINFDINQKVPEVNGLTVALVGYMLGTYEVVNKGTGNKVALGGFISVLDVFTERFNAQEKVSQIGE